MMPNDGMMPNDVVPFGGMTLLHVYSAFVRQLSRYAFAG